MRSQQTRFLVLFCSGAGNPASSTSPQPTPPAAYTEVPSKSSATPIQDRMDSTEQPKAGSSRAGPACPCLRLAAALGNSLGLC